MPLMSCIGRCLLAAAAAAAAAGPPLLLALLLLALLPAAAAGQAPGALAWGTPDTAPEGSRLLLVFMAARGCAVSRRLRLRGKGSCGVEDVGGWTSLQAGLNLR
jgi:hypothetical protein